MGEQDALRSSSCIGRTASSLSLNNGVDVKVQSASPRSLSASTVSILGHNVALSSFSAALQAEFADAVATTPTNFGTPPFGGSNIQRATGSNLRYSSGVAKRGSVRLDRLRRSNRTKRSRRVHPVIERCAAGDGLRALLRTAAARTDALRSVASPKRQASQHGNHDKCRAAPRRLTEHQRKRVPYRTRLRLAE
ncbi:hypothetical protein SAMN05216525_11182 [Bradyrhizobium sp. Gha]|nr:hypothetical protein SAMN05216525_11182 [Bradyrhizobium sp. Gha]